MPFNFAYPYKSNRMVQYVVRYRTTGGWEEKYFSGPGAQRRAMAFQRLMATNENVLQVTRVQVLYN